MTSSSNTNESLISSDSTEIETETDKTTLLENLNKFKSSDLETRIGILTLSIARKLKTNIIINNNNNEYSSSEKFKNKIIPVIASYVGFIGFSKIQKRRVGRWYLCETLGKGGYSWVKKGVDEKNGKMVALKFISKKNNLNWSESQIKQIRTEIEVLKSIKHPNIMKLLAYNLKCKYPGESENDPSPYDSVILLVLEYMAGGELFDYLYYTGRFSEIIARTYFEQLISAVYVCHSHGVIHRDIKPQNLLLDHKFQLKLTDFGLSKLVMTENDKLMTTHVGTGGYQAPEIVENRIYTKAVDVFACGVVLFIFIAGHPPFNDASSTDKWYKYIYSGQLKYFWKSHKNSQKYFNKSILDLCTRMLLKDPKQRIKLSKLYKHQWIKNIKPIDNDSLYKYFQIKHKQMRNKRQIDTVKQNMLDGDTPFQPENIINKAIFETNNLLPHGFNINTKPPTINLNNVLLNIYDINLKQKYKYTWEVFESITQIIEDPKGLKGQIIDRDYQTFSIIAKSGIMRDKDVIEIKISFQMFYNKKDDCLFLQIRNVTELNNVVTYDIANKGYHFIMKKKAIRNYLEIDLRNDKLHKNDDILNDDEQKLLKMFDIKSDEKINKNVEQIDDENYKNEYYTED